MNVQEYYENMNYCPTCKKAKALEIIKNKIPYLYLTLGLIGATKEDIEWRTKYERNIPRSV